jgi:hypothetical protein
MVIEGFVLQLKITPSSAIVALDSVAQGSLDIYFGTRSRNSEPCSVSCYRLVSDNFCILLGSGNEITELGVEQLKNLLR